MDFGLPLALVLGNAPEPERQEWGPIPTVTTVTTITIVTIVTKVTKVTLLFLFF